MKFKIVYLDDEPALCQLFKDNFDAPELDVSTFEDADAAIQEINQNGADLIFLDFRLKGTTADEVVARIPQNLAIALVTGELIPSTEFQFIKVFSKPFHFSELETFVNHMIKEKTKTTQQYST